MKNRQAITDKRIIEAYDRCVSIIETGATISDCQKLYPEMEELEKSDQRQVMDMLEATLMLKKAYPESEEAAPTKQFMEAGREQFLAAAKAKNQPTVSATTLFPLRISGFIRNAYAMSAVAATAIIVLAGGLVNYSSDSLPGSALYTVKRITENTKLALTFDENSKAQLHYELAQKRITEVAQLMESGDSGNAESVYTDAKESLNKASKIAEAGAKGDSKEDLKEDINSLSKTIEKQSSKLALRFKGDNGKSPGLNNADNKDGRKEKENTDQQNSSNATTDNKIAQSYSAAETLGANTANKGIGEDNGVLTAEDKNNYGEKKEAGSVNDNSKNSNHKGTSTFEAKKDSTDGSGESIDDKAAMEKATASMIPFEVDAIRVSEGSFSPNGDGVKDMVRVFIDGATIEGFSVGVYQSSTKIVNILEQSSAKDEAILWNGTGQDGSRLPDGEYTLRVLNSTGQMAHKKAKVVIDTKAPRIKVVGPPNGIITDNQTPQFVWKDNENIGSYYLHIVPDSNSVSKTKTKTNITNNFYEPSEKLSPGLWTWRVIAIDEAGNVGVSPYSELTIELPEHQNKEAKIL